MEGLIYKEFISNKKNIKYYAYVCAFVMISLLTPYFVHLVLPGTSLYDEMTEARKVLTCMFGSILILFFAEGMIPAFSADDERRVWACFMISTPTAAKGVIEAKYYFMLIIDIIAIFFAYVCDTVYTAIYELDFSSIMISVSIFYTLLLFKAVTIPFTVRFGTKNAGSIRAVIFLLICCAAGIYALFGDLSIFNPDRLMDELVKIANGESESKVMAAISALMPYVAIAAYYFSCKISCKLYMKGVDTYDR